MHAGEDMAEIKKTNEAVSVSINKLAEGSHLFKVTGHSLLLIKTRNSYKMHIQSTPFQVGGNTWAINYYPGWFCLHPSFYAVLLSEGKDVKAKVQFNLVNQSGESYQGTPYKDKFFHFWRKGTEHGRFFIPQFRLLQYLQNDNFTIRCTLRVLESSVKQIMPHPITKAPPSKICSNFGGLLDSKEGADVTLEVKGKLFPAHKCILAARSPYFRAEFFGPMRKRETGNHREVQDMEPAVFMALLRYIYTDSFSEIEQELQLSRITLAEKLLVVADQFLVDGLKVMCEDILCDNKISVDNAAMRLALALQYNHYDRPVCK